MMFSRSRQQSEAGKAATVLLLLAAQLMALVVGVAGVAITKGNFWFAIGLFIANVAVALRLAGVAMSLRIDDQLRALVAAHRRDESPERGGNPRKIRADDEPRIQRRPKAGEPRWPP